MVSRSAVHRVLGDVDYRLGHDVSHRSTGLRPLSERLRNGGSTCYLMPPKGDHTLLYLGVSTRRASEMSALGFVGQLRTETANAAPARGCVFHRVARLSGTQTCNGSDGVSVHSVGPIHAEGHRYYTVLEVHYYTGRARPPATARAVAALAAEVARRAETTDDARS